MKKVLILTVIAILALGVMAWAGTYTTFTANSTPGSVTVDSTCATAALQVYSAIGIEQGYYASATSFNASYCGATGNPLTGFYMSEGNNVLLADLYVKSNMSTITVEVSFSSDGVQGLSSIPGFGNNVTEGAEYNYTNNVLTLQPPQSGVTYYEGYLYVYGPSNVGGWVEAGHHTLTTTFTIEPEHDF